MTIRRFERGEEFLDLTHYIAKSIDEDGYAVYDEAWEVSIYSRKAVPSEGQYLDFASEVVAMLFINENGWKEQVL